MKTFVDFLPGTCIDKGPSVHFGEFQAGQSCSPSTKHEHGILTHMTGWAALMDISLAFIPWTVLWNVQIRLPEKIGIGISMSLGIL